MPSIFRQPRSLPEWIEPDYFRRARGLRRLKGWLVLAALLVPLAVVTTAVVIPRGRKVYQAGPVSDAHAQFANQCETCHTQSFATAGHFLGDDGRSSVIDAACMTCHHDHPHHPTEETHTVHCAECHREHRGHPALARVADGQCANCHADLARAVKPGVEVQYKPVPDFVSHPEFALWRSQAGDPGRLNFNHQAHLAELVMREGEVLVPRKLGCGDCHQPDAAGLFMQPIRYEKHCARCHQLQAPLAGEWRDKAIEGAVQAFRKAALPHPAPGQSAETVRGVLRDRLTRLAREHPAIVKAGAPASPEPPIPGRRRAPPVSAEVFQWVNEHLDESESVLFDRKAGCLLCHQERSDPQQRPRGLPDLAPPNLPDRWFSHSTFSHKAHQVSKCVDCHKDAETSRDAHDVLMPRLDDCRQCHGPGTGVRSECVTCHGYHHLSP